MLLLYLPIIIFEAMFEAKENKLKAGEIHIDLIEGPSPPDGPLAAVHR